MSTLGSKISLWCGYGFFVLYLIGIVVVAGFVPPPAPSWAPSTIATFFETRQTRILIGMSICAFASALYVPWGIAISGQMLRMERVRFPILSVVQGVSAVAGAVFFALSPLMWLTLAFRPAHSADTIQTLNDFAWISWIVSWPFFFIQAAAMGLCILLSNTSHLPRWLGYLSVYFGLSMFPASAIVFFTTGPFAWNGLFGIYLPLGMFALWFNVVTLKVNRAIDDERDEAGPRNAEPAAAASEVARAALQKQP